MDDGRYTLTLDEVPAEIIAIRQIGVPCGLIQPRMEAGYLLTDGTTLLESEKDENGFYIGGAGMDGMYLRTPQRYEPVRNDSGKSNGVPPHEPLPHSTSQARSRRPSSSTA